ncbi:MAG: hypothetical protein WCR22_05470, partial [Bacteroidales bacterium]
WIFGHSSSKRAVFEDRPWIFGHSSSKRAVFEDRPWIFGHSSSRLFFWGKPANREQVMKPAWQ